MTLNESAPLSLAIPALLGCLGWSPFRVGRTAGPRATCILAGVPGRVG
jgi:hypothetical protein